MKFLRNVSIGLCALLACAQLNAVKIWLDQNGLFSIRSVEVYAMDFSWEDLDVYIRDGYVADGQQIDESLCFSIQFANEPALQVVCQSSPNWNKSMVETLDSSVLREYGINDLKIKAFVPTSGDQAVNVLNQLALEQEHSTLSSHAQSHPIASSSTTSSHVQLPLIVNRECEFCCEERPVSDFFSEPVFECKKRSDGTFDSDMMCKVCTLKALEPKRGGEHRLPIDTFQCPYCRAPLKKDSKTVELIRAEPEGNSVIEAILRKEPGYFSVIVNRECEFCCEERPVSDFFSEPVFECKKRSDGTFDSGMICKVCTLKALKPKRGGEHELSIDTFQCPYCRASLKKDSRTVELIRAEPEGNSIIEAILQKEPNYFERVIQASRVGAVDQLLLDSMVRDFKRIINNYTQMMGYFTVFGFEDEFLRKVAFFDNNRQLVVAFWHRLEVRERFLFREMLNDRHLNWMWVARGSEIKILLNDVFDSPTVEPRV